MSSYGNQEVQSALLGKLLDRLFRERRWPDYEEFYRENIDDRWDVESLLSQKLFEKDGRGGLTLGLPALRELRDDPRVAQLLEAADSALLDLRHTYRTSGAKGQPHRTLDEIVETTGGDRFLIGVALLFLARARCVSGYTPDDDGLLAKVTIPSDILDRNSVRLALLHPAGHSTWAQLQAWLGEFSSFFDLYLESEDCRSELDASLADSQGPTDRAVALGNRIQLLLELTRDLVRGTENIVSVTLAIGHFTRARLEKRVLESEQNAEALSTVQAGLEAVMFRVLEDRTEEEKRLGLLFAVCRASQAGGRGGILRERLGFCRAFDAIFVKRWLQWADEHGYVEYSQVSDGGAKALVLPTRAGGEAVDALLHEAHPESFQSFDPEVPHVAISEPEPEVWSVVRQEYHCNQRQFRRRLVFVKEPVIKRMIVRDTKGAVVCLRIGEWKAATILAGSTIEAILAAALDSGRPHEESVGSASEGAARRPPSQGRKRTLEQLIDEAQQCGNIDKSTASLLSAVREWRNLIHPDREVRSGTRLGKNTAETAVRAVFQLMEMLRIPPPALGAGNK